MAQISRPWNGTSTGDATEAPYDAPTEFAEILMSVSQAGRIATNKGGVFPDDLNELEVSGSSSPVAVASGRALVYGTWYENDAAVTVAVATPASSTRIDRIVLRKSWSAQTVRIQRIAGTEGGAAPSLVQIAGTTWDIPLAQVSITTGGVITVTDERELVGENLTIDVFDTSTNWTKRAGLKGVYAKSIAGGGGGGSGRRGAAASTRGGGSGGGGGGHRDGYIPAEALGATEAVTVGGEGTGGAAITSDDTNGDSGTEGGDSSFGDHVVAQGGSNGVGGNSAGDSSGGNGGGLGVESTLSAAKGYDGGRGHTSSVNGQNSEHGGGGGGRGTDTSGTAGRGSMFGGGGGGGGAGIRSSDLLAGGSAGGRGNRDALTPTGAGAAGAEGEDGGDGGDADFEGIGGAGGGGGGSHATSPGNGGNGGNPGGGGGGGAASANGANSGRGGDGGPGRVVVYNFF